MTDQPGDLINEAGKLFDAVLKRVVGGGSRDDDDREHRGGRSRGGADDAWADATADAPRYATGAPECCHCPVCRAIAVSRESGHDVGRHVRDAGRSLMAAALDVVQGFDRTRPEDNRNRPPRPEEASPGPGTGRSDRSGTEKAGEEPGDPWAAATGGDAIDIG
ncbi:hypothetical protein [Actinomadura verrucosospora]|uniref:Uncharacterized protein n=1 Tax=Actinomadura verrucosospora TaxID=46165 RepID=A0A7D4AW42_ACTVE|nr:hypothetical protein [Actinomadura verrucosospora]QKG26489.1 hypothetical protein ACTIVE_8142 [Actinomadura verrucosospora]